MNTYIDDSRIETRFVWARCDAKNARAMRDLIRSFQEDGWTPSRTERKQESRRSSNR
jgi:hypothetical protein